MTPRIIFDLVRGTVNIEGVEAQLLNIVQELRKLAPKMEIRILTGAASGVGGSQDTPHEPGHGTSIGERKPAIREFARSLPTTNTYERIAALAYHATKIDKRAAFSPKEMEDWFSLCGFKKPSNMRVALADGKRKYGYVVNRGRGQWTLATGGENIIMEMLEKKRG